MYIHLNWEVKFTWGFKNVRLNKNLGQQFCGDQNYGVMFFVGAETEQISNFKSLLSFNTNTATLWDTP